MLFLSLSLRQEYSLYNLFSEGTLWKGRRYDARYFLPFHLELRVFRCILMTGSRETDEFAIQGLVENWRGEKKRNADDWRFEDG